MTQQALEGTGQQAGALPLDENPRLVITGVTNPPSTLKYAGMVESAAPVGGAAFDWYAATIYDDVDAVLDTLAARLGGEVVEGHALNGYERGYAIKTPGGIVARVLAGGNGGKPHAFGGGVAGAEVAAAVRGEWGDAHHVSRLDTRMDFGARGEQAKTWDELHEVCVSLAARYGLKTSVAGDYYGKQDGRTLYIGSRKSQVFVRLYEKGKQLRRDTRESQREVIPEGWCRLEAQLRPAGDARFAAARLDAEAAWGASKWTKELALATNDLNVERVTLQVKRESDDMRAFHWMGQQYGAMLDRLVKENGRAWLDAQLDGWFTAMRLAERSQQVGD